jgi:hypothetical protein
MPDKCGHKHLIIAISGFLSENADQSEDWAHLKALCVKHGVPLLAICWEANTATSIGSVALDGLKNLKIGKTKALLGGTKGIVSELLSIENLKVAYDTVKNTSNATVEMFKKSRLNAKKTGTVLGHYLNIENNLESYSISLIGFSLGTQVIKSCLNTLAKYHKLSPMTKTPITNVYLLGGATFIKTEKRAYQKDIFASVVNGRICNVFT